MSIEAVYESMALKRSIFAELDRVARPGCVLATNTSTLDIDAIADVTSRPESVIGLHLFSPAHVMRLLEIVRGERTTPEVIATALALGKRLGKVGVVVRNLPGFVGNRMMFPYMYETQFLVEEGTTPAQVDRALTSFGMAMGMFAVDDMAGLDVAWRVKQELADRVGLRKIYERVSAFHHDLGPRWEPAPLLVRLAEAGTTFRDLDLEREKVGSVTVPA